jgi:hypothetical protein
MARPTRRRAWHRPVGVPSAASERYIYNGKGDGVHWGGKPGTTTGTYPGGQVDSIVENVWIRLAGGKGFYYYGPTDAYGDTIFIASPGGIGLDTANMDFGYVHVYGALQGVVINATSVPC